MLVQLGNKQSQRRPENQPLEIDLLAAGVIHRWNRLYAGTVLNPAQTPVVVYGVAEKLVSVLDHLLQNAVDAAGPSGRVELSVFATAEDGVIEVIDNGPGMTKEFIRDRLFRPLETSKAHGSGLGAFQALKMVREMGGRLEVDSVVGRGTTMRLSLPLFLGGNLNTQNISEEISYANGSL
jgi:signal transduction histidine kinase